MQVQVSLILDLSATATLTQMEEQIQQQGHHWMREAMKSAIRNWEQQHQRCPACGSRHVRLEGTVPRVLLTQFGRVRLALRRMRCQDCLHRWCPARQLFTSLHHQRVTEPLREIAVLAGASWPYRHASQMLERLSGAQISAEELRRLTNEQGQALAKQQQALASSPCELTHAQTDAVSDADASEVADASEAAGASPTIIGMDGGWVASRDQRGGMEGKVAVIAQDKVLLPTKPRPDPSSLTWYEIAKRAKKGYRLAPAHPRARWKRRIYVATFDSSRHLGVLAAHAASTLGWEPATSVVVGDGADWIKKEAKRHFAGAKCILDWPHLWRVIRKAVNETAREQQQSEQWRSKQSQQLKSWLWHGQGDKVRERLQQWQDEASPRSTGKALREALRYLEHQHEWMGSYEQWRQQGYPVGSGIIERAVSLVINRRMKKRGMRWRRPNATAVVALRVTFLNTDWQQPSLARTFP